MSLIKCPECSAEISTLAKMCPHCGCPQEIILNNSIESQLASHTDIENIIYCPECQEIIQEGIDACPNCGCPGDRIKKLIENEKYLCLPDDQDACWFCGKYHATKVYEYRVHDLEVNHVPGDDSFKQKVSFTAKLPCCEQCYEHFDELDKPSSKGGWIAVFLYLPFLLMLCVLIPDALIPILMFGLFMGLPLSYLIGRGLGKAIGLAFRNKRLGIYSASLKNSIEDSNFDVKVKNYLKRTTRYFK